MGLQNKVGHSAHCHRLLTQVAVFSAGRNRNRLHNVLLFIIVVRDIFVVYRVHRFLWEGLTIVC